MKTRFASIVLFALGAPLAPHAATPAKTASGPAPARPAAHAAPLGPPAAESADVDLQFTVTLPADASLFRTDNIADEMARLVQTEFARRGFHGKLTYITWSDTPLDHVPRLDLNLIDWRYTPTHTVDCTFGAEWATASNENNLGIFTGLALTTGGFATPFDRAGAYKQAATQAIDDLFVQLTTLKLVADHSS